MDIQIKKIIEVDNSVKSKKEINIVLKKHPNDIKKVKVAVAGLSFS